MHNKIPIHIKIHFFQLYFHIIKPKFLSILHKKPYIPIVLSKNPLKLTENGLPHFHSANKILPKQFSTSKAFIYMFSDVKIS